MREGVRRDFIEQLKNGRFGLKVQAVKANLIPLYIFQKGKKNDSDALTCIRKMYTQLIAQGYRNSKNHKKKIQ